LGDHSPHLPNEFGFDFFFGALYSNDMKPYRLYLNDQVAVEAPVDQDYLTKKLTENAIQFIEDHAGQPFFLYYAQPFPHNPLHASPDFQGTSQAGVYGDAVQEIDWSVGQIVDVLKARGIYENTCIIFTSDNGPWHEGNPGYQRGRKYLPFEGGVRVPMVASWPAKIPPGQATDAPAINLDFFPTILATLGIPLPEDRIIDGQDMGDLLTGKTQGSPHAEVFYFFDNHVQAIRMGKWKFHIRHMSDNAANRFLKLGPFLFNLEEDPNESYDQKMRYPDQAGILSRRLKEWRLSLRRNLRGWK
jgi:arylsulfatase A-like enzyme